MAMTDEERKQRRNMASKLCRERKKLADPEEVKRLANLNSAQSKQRQLATNPELYRAMQHLRSQQHKHKLTLELFAAYGDRCVCCADATFEFLEVHHKFSGGAAHRKALGIISGGGQTLTLYADLRTRNYPKDVVELLCANCHRAVTRQGFCPHQPGVMR